VQDLPVRGDLQMMCDGRLGHGTRQPRLQVRRHGAVADTCIQEGLLVLRCFVAHLRDAPQAVDAVVREGFVDLGEARLKATPASSVESVCGILDAASTEFGRETQSCPFVLSGGAGQQLVPDAFQEGIVLHSVRHVTCAEAEGILAGGASIEAKKGTRGVFGEALFS
jgi:hypothetical protein